MAILVSLQAAETEVVSGQPASFILTIRNTGTAAVNLRNVSFFPASAGSSALLSQPYFAPAATTQILASGSLRVPLSGTFYALPQPSTSQTQQTPVGVTAVVTTREGTTDTNTAAPTVTMQVVPVAQPPNPLPVVGQWDFSSNNNSALALIPGLSPF